MASTVCETEICLGVLGFYNSADYDLLTFRRYNKELYLKTNSEVQRINVGSPSSLSVPISVVADPTVLCNP